MIIREATTNDYEKLDRLANQLHELHVKERPDLFAKIEHLYSAEKYDNMLEDPNRILLLAEIEDKVVGVCIVGVRDQSMMVNLRNAYIRDLVVDESYRHQGIAKKLFVEAEKRAKAAGAVRLDLQVSAFNEGAIHLYEELGMTPQSYIYEKKL